MYGETILRFFRLWIRQIGNMNSTAAGYSASDHTFVVCAYKENHYLEETISSLERQSTKSSILVSTSTPNEYIRAICNKHQIEMVVNPSPHYAGDDWNYGYNCANTPLVTIVHQDDNYESTYLEEALSAFNAYPLRDVLIAFSDYYEIRNDRPVQSNLMLQIKRIMNHPFRLSSLNKSSFIKKSVLRFGCPICCPAVTLNKELLGDSVFDTTLKDSCDYKTWVNLASRSGRFVYIKERLVGHRIYLGSATSRNLEDDIRTSETLSILEMLWPRSIARLVNRVYSASEKLNTVN